MSRRYGRHCTECGSVLKAGARYCSSCGATVQVVESRDSESRPVDENGIFYATGRGLGRYWRWVMSGGFWRGFAGIGGPILVVLIVIGAISGDGEEQRRQTSSSSNVQSSQATRPAPTQVQSIAQTRGALIDSSLAIACELAGLDDGKPASTCTHNSLVLYEGALADLTLKCREDMKTIAGLVRRANDALEGTDVMHQHIQLLVAVDLVIEEGRTGVDCAAVFKRLVERAGRVF